MAMDIYFKSLEVFALFGKYCSTYSKLRESESAIINLFSLVRF